jgi:serine/threonine protein kinase
VHRDVKPGNILIRDLGGTEHVYLSDFGMARPSNPGAHLTQTGLVVGTTGYLSPEQIRGTEPGPHSDLYALGCLFFEALTGAPPFRGENEMALQWAHANDPRPIPSMVVPALGKRYDQFVSRSLAISPEHRIASGHQFAHALAVAHSGQAIGPSAVPITPSHEPTVVGPSTPLPPAALQTPPPQPVMYQGHGYATPAPQPSHPSRGGNPLALVLLAIVALAGIGVGALIAAGVFAHNGSTRTVVTGVQARATAHQRADGPRQAARSATTNAHSSTSTNSASPTLPGSPVTSQDSNGYNTGPGCSDDPQTSLPGCNDSPSAPNGDAVSSCSGSGALEVYSATTSCGLAGAVVSNYSTDGPVTVTDGSGTKHTFTCQTGGQGTTGDTICVSGSGQNELYLRWLQQ